MVVDRRGRAPRCPACSATPTRPLDESFERGPARVPAVHAPGRVPRRAPCPRCCCSGNHERIRRWRRLQSLVRTRERRPDLFARARAQRRRSRAPRRRSSHDAACAPPSRSSTTRSTTSTSKVVTTALTNLDLHDIARSSRTYGLGGFFIVHPVAAQRELAAPHRRALAGRRGRREERLPPPGDRPARGGPRSRRRRRRHRPRATAPRPWSAPPPPAIPRARSGRLPRLRRHAAAGPPGAARPRHRLGPHRRGRSPAVTSASRQFAGLATTIT